MIKNFFLYLIFLIVMSCNKISILENSNINFNEIKSASVKNLFQVNYFLENFNSPNLDETRCLVNYKIKNISNKDLFAALSIKFQSKGDFFTFGHIAGEKLSPNEVFSGKYSFEKIPCDYLEELSFIY